MNRATVSAAVIAATVLACAPAARAAEETDPFEAEVFAGAAHDDNLFRLADDETALEETGTDETEDWYRYVGAGFRARFAGDRRHFDLNGEIFRQTYDEFDFLDHNAGELNASGEWQLSPATTALFGYGYERRLQSFTNKESVTKDIIDQHDVTAGIEHTLAERWQVRAQAGFADLDFSTSDFLDKQRLDGEAELRYAASQNSIFGLLATWTQSDFDDGDTRDFSGWSVGPSFEWQVRSSIQLSANLGYTHRGLDESGTLEDFDGVTGYVATLWAPGDRFSSEIRLFREISNLGGEVSEYTEITGFRWRPTWQLTPKLSTRVELGYEERDFGEVEDAEDRDDDYMLADVWLDFDLTERFLVSLGYGYEQRDSNEDEEEFDAHMFRTELRFAF